MLDRGNRRREIRDEPLGWRIIEQVLVESSAVAFGLWLVVLWLVMIDLVLGFVRLVEALPR